MKRTPLVRKTPFARGTASLARRALKQRSSKRETEMVDRRALVRRVLDARPVCERCESARSTDVHEPHTRARGGSITDPENVRALCRACHDWVHSHPAEASEEGWLRRSTG